MSNFSTFILMFGLNPDDYSGEEVEPIKINNGWIVNLKQSTSKEKRICPNCQSTHVQIKDYHTIEYSISDNIGEHNLSLITHVTLHLYGM